MELERRSSPRRTPLQLHSNTLFEFLAPYYRTSFRISFRLTRLLLPVSFAEPRLSYITPDMKKMFVLSMFISFAMICSCQKQDSIAEAQLAQRKTELDAREEALVQREKAVAEREKAVATGRIIQSRRQAPDAAQAEADRQRRIQQLPPELRALIPPTPDPARMKAERDRKMQEQLR